MVNKKIIIVGAGPGGLAAGMLLASRGHQVEIYEKNGEPGGRCGQISLGDYKFDIGPTFFMMKHVLDEIFEKTGRKSEDYIDFMRLDPMYKLVFENKDMFIYEDKKKMAEQLNKTFGESEKGLEKFYKFEKKRYEALYPILSNHNNNILDALRWRFLSALPYFAIGRSLYGVMSKYFDNELARLSFTFQSKYLGMSPWECPGAFGLVPYVEHAEGIYHIKGGLAEVPKAMEKVVTEEGGQIFYGKTVKEIINKGIILENGEKIMGDEVIVNSDFGYAATNLFKNLKKHSKKKIEKKKYSCSIFMMYLGVKKQYKLGHHTIVFAKKYKKNVKDIFSGELSGEDLSLYIRDTSETDPGVAPKGKSALYILVPVPNKFGKPNWTQDKAKVREWTLATLKNRLGMTDIEDQIEQEKIITPDQWESDYNVYKGAVFAMSHNLGQMLWFRPHNKFEELDNCYLVGGNTHPGSGLPTIFKSGQIVADLISKT